MPSSATERPRGLVRTRADEILFVGMLEFVSKQACVCLGLKAEERPCIPCQASTRRVEVERTLGVRR